VGGLCSLIFVLAGCGHATRSATVSRTMLAPPGHPPGAHPLQSESELTSFNNLNPLNNLNLQPGRTPVIPASLFVQTGMASWYGPGFHGKLTANGEIYNQYDMTAAHRSLPLGTRAMVTNLRTGQAVEVRINDRGPFVEGRIIDLSLGAAKSIGVYGPGVVTVRLEVISAPTRVLSVLYAVQVGSYTDAAKAATFKQYLTRRFRPVYISPFLTSRFRYYQVRLGPFAERHQAEQQARALAQTGIYAVIVEEDDRWAEW